MSFDRIIYFGDSLTDSGAFFSLSSQLTVFPLPSAAFGYAGQFSNGQVYADIAPTILGIGADESVNYAVGGGRAVGPNPLGFLLANSPLGVANPDPALVAFDSNLGGQIGRFLGDVPQLGDLSNSAASFFIGLNDFSDLADTIDPLNFDPVAFGAAAQQLAGDIIASTLAGAVAAAQAGVGTIIINTLPVGGFFPLGQALPDFAKPLADQLVRDFNDALVANAQGLQQLGVEVTVVDFEAMADEIMANGATHGFLNTTESLFLGTGADPEFIDPDGDGPLPPLPTFEINPELAALDQDQFAFYDLLHPTTALHGVLGAFQAATLDGAEVAFLGDDRNFHRGSRGDDLTFAQGGNDRVAAGSGEDVIFGGDGRDFIRGGSENDIIAGGADADFLFGDGDADVLAGNGGNDLLNGGAGNDALVGGLGSDRVFGGAGDDVFFYTDAGLIGGTTGESFDYLRGGAGHDTLYLVVGEDVREGVEAEAARGGSPIDFHRFTDLNLITLQIEEIVVLDSRADFDAQTVPEDLQETLDEAEFWGLV